MATILLNESDPVRHELLRLQLQCQGHKVWSARHLNDVIATLHDVAVDLMILDLDYQNLDELSAFASRWRGIKILFQASSTALLQDFRCWMADQFVFKFQNGENVSRAVAQLLQPKPLRRRNNYGPQKSYYITHGQVAVA
jgi:DNA-binding response OmpR family regulator